MAGIFFFLMTVLILWEVRIVSAQEINSARPITSPVSYFIKGRIFYAFRLSETPAQGVRVVATNQKSKISFETRTKNTGEYSLGVTEIGKYKVQASDDQGTKFMPPVRLVNILNANVTGVDFWGFLRPQK